MGVRANVGRLSLRSLRARRSVILSGALAKANAQSKDPYYCNAPSGLSRNSNGNLEANNSFSHT
jgi:hypothetical protein